MSLVERGYQSAKAVTLAHAKSFAFASHLLFGARRRGAFALYAFCRRLDDMVDSPGADPLKLPERLAAARAQVHRIYEQEAPGAAPEVLQHGLPEDELAALRDTVQRFHIPEQPFQDLISGMEMDLTVRRYETYSQLDLYCYRVAGTVGLLLAPMLGCTEAWALGPAADLGRAMQLTNILRDVKEDLGRDRIYLPLDELAAHGITEAQLREGRTDERMRGFMRAQIARARMLYARAATGEPALKAPGGRHMVRLMASIYGDILTSIEKQDLDVFAGRARVSLARKLWLTLGLLVPQAEAGAGGRSPSGEPAVSARKVAVVGGGLGGLAAAGLLAREGLEVTLFEQGPALGGKAQALRFGDTVLDTGPTLLTMPEVVRETFAQLGAMDLLPELIELREQCTYHWADGKRFTAHRDATATAESVAEAWPDEAAHVGAFYREAEAIWRAAGEPYLEAPFEGMAGFFSRVARRGPRAVAAGMRMGTLAGLGERHFDAPELQQFVGRFATYAGASPFAASAAFALIPHIERAFGTFHVKGGMGALSAALAAATARAGVRAVLGQRVAWAPEGSGFRVGEERFDAVIVNADPLASLGREREPLSLSGYVLLLEFPQRLSLPHHTVSFSSDSRREFDALFSGVQPDDPTLYFCHPAATDATMAAPGTSGLFVMANAPALASMQDEWPERERVRAQCLERVRQLVPGAAPRVLAERTPVDLARQGAPGGSIYGFLPHGLLGPFRRPLLRGPVPGLFYAGGGTHPGGGVPLVLRSGRFAASLALEHLRGAA